MGIFFLLRKTDILNARWVAAKIRIPAIYNMTYFIAELSIYFYLSRGNKLRLLYSKALAEIVPE